MSDERRLHFDGAWYVCGVCDTVWSKNRAETVGYRCTVCSPLTRSELFSVEQVNAAVDPSLPAGVIRIDGQPYPLAEFPSA
jgi:hypothetical protein